MKKPKTPSRPSNPNKKSSEDASGFVWKPDENETRVLAKAEALGLSLHRCAKASEVTPVYGLFDEKNRLPDPAIEYCAPLNWMEKWLDEHPDIDRYAQECRDHLIDSIKGWRKMRKTRIPEDVPPPPERTRAVSDLRARLDRILQSGPSTPPPIDRVKG